VVIFAVGQADSASHDRLALQLLLMYTGEVFTQADFTAVPAIDRSDIDKRVCLAQAAMDAVISNEPAWFNEDANYEVALGVPLRAGLQLSRVMRAWRAGRDQ
jgi:hypothetical protein